MLKWTQIDQNLLVTEQKKTFKSLENIPHYECMIKKVMGIADDENIHDFEFELSVFGPLSECSLAAKLESDPNIVKAILKSGKAEQVNVVFDNNVHHEDLLNLFDKEDELKPSMAMLNDFLDSRKASFQTLPGNVEKVWVSQWSDVNSWAFYWETEGKFYCLARMSG